MVSAAAVIQHRSIEFDGAEILTEVYVDRGYQMVPATFFRETGAQVNWNASYRAVVISQGSYMIALPVDQSYADYGLAEFAGWERDHLLTTTRIVADKSYVPFGYVAEKLGLQVKYEAKTKKTRLHTITSESANIEDAVSAEELYWLYQITEAEAGGESYDGRVAVAASILNRVAHVDWPNTIIETIFQVTYDEAGKAYYQYSPVLDQRIYTVSPSDETKEAVLAALQGEDPTAGATVFYNPDKTDNKWVRSRPELITIGAHIFAE